MRYALSCLWRNLRAGLRLALLLPVTRLGFRIDVAQLLLLFCLSVLIDVAGDWWKADPPRHFWVGGAGAELFFLGVFLLATALIALANRQKALLLALPVIAFASLPLVQITNYATYVFAARADVPAEAELVEQLLVLWIIVVLIRSVFVAFLHPPVHMWLRAIGGGLLLALPIWFAGAIYHSDPWWLSDGETPDGGATLDAASEVVLAAQTQLMQDAIDELKDERPGQSDLYFIGFAPYARGDGYGDVVEAAQQAMNANWGTSGRSLSLVNSGRTLLTRPLATVSNLRETLNELGGFIDVEDDVVMVYLAGRGASGGRLVADMPPLSLVSIGPAGLKLLLDDAGIRWRIIVVSACHSGDYLKPLEDENTMLLTSGAPGDGAQDCAEGREAQRFGRALFENGLGRGQAFDAAFDAARAEIAPTSPGAGPQLFVGSAMAEKLKTLRKGGTSGTMVGMPSWRIQG